MTLRTWLPRLAPLLLPITAGSFVWLRRGDWLSLVPQNDQLILSPLAFFVGVFPLLAVYFRHTLVSGLLDRLQQPAACPPPGASDGFRASGPAATGMVKTMGDLEALITRSAYYQRCRRLVREHCLRRRRANQLDRHHGSGARHCRDSQRRTTVCRMAPAGIPSQNRHTSAWPHFWSDSDSWCSGSSRQLPVPRTNLLLVPRFSNQSNGPVHRSFRLLRSSCQSP